MQEVCSDFEAYGLKNHGLTRSDCTCVWGFFFFSFLCVCSCLVVNKEGNICAQPVLLAHIALRAYHWSNSIYKYEPSMWNEA